MSAPAGHVADDRGDSDPAPWTGQAARQEEDGSGLTPGNLARALFHPSLVITNCDRKTMSDPAGHVADDRGDSNPAPWTGQAARPEEDGSGLTAGDLARSLFHPNLVITNCEVDPP